MTSEEECSEAGEAGAVYRSSASSAVPESADSHSQSEMPVTDLNPQPSEASVCDSADDTAREDSWRVNIETLPDEILVKIFSHISFTELIDVVQKVSTRWKRLSQDAELWTNKEYEFRSWKYPEYDTCKAGWTDQEAIQTFRDVPNLRSVRMWRGAKARVFRALCDSCPRLAQLHLYRTQKFSYSVLSNLVEKCPHIHTLKISSNLLKCERLSEAVSRLQHLRVLILDEFQLDKAPVLHPLGDSCPQLAEVDFGWMTVDFDDLRYFLNAKRNTLKCVRIKWTMAGKRCVVPLLAPCADSLESLHLYKFDVERDEAREAFTALGSLKNLQELRMSITEPLPPGVAALAFQAGGLPKLRLLDLRDSSGLTDDAVVEVSRGCPALRELCVSDAVLLTDAAFSQIHHLQYLETLDVADCKRLGGALVPRLTRLPRLHTLRMGGLDCRELQPGLARIVELSGLRSLILDRCLITGVPFDKFPGNLLCLRLDVSACKGLGGALVPCLTRLPHLHTLRMEELDFPKLQPGLDSIVQLSGLRSLTLDNSLITGIPFHEFPGKLLCLRELNVRFCHGDPKATEGLTEQMPGLKIHDKLEEEALTEYTDSHESDAELAEEENEENRGADDAGGISDLFLESVYE